MSTVSVPARSTAVNPWGVWAALVAATLLTSGVLKGSIEGTWALVGVFALASAKVLGVLLEFVELGAATSSARWLFLSWAVVVPASLCAIVVVQR